VAVLRVEAGLFFANAEHVRQAILAHARADGVKAVVIDAETMPYVDVTAAEMLSQVRDIGQVRDVLREAGADDGAALFPSVEDAVRRVR
jgi:sulfate permease, SulP family